MGSSSYSAPGAAKIKRCMGVNTDILGQTTAELDAALAELVADAEAEMRAVVGSASVDLATLESWQVLLLQEAVAYGAAWRFLEGPYVQLLTGTQQPLLFEDPEAFRKQVDALKGEAADKANLARKAIDAGTATATEGQVLSDFSSSDDRAFTRAMEF